jgi:GAF domain-containing protein
MDSHTAGKDAAFRRFNETLAQDGLRAALAYLLSLSDFRFIALFRQHGDKANAAVFYDREHPEVLRVDEVPASATYCQLAIQSKSPFKTGDALADPRLTSHAAREAVQSYWGLPVMTPEGEILGTLCTYDVVPRDPQQIDLQLMVEVASTIEQKGLVPPYPARAAARGRPA